MKRIAPTLHGRMVEVKLSADRACEYCPEWAEYRALLRVVRALKRERKYDMPPWPNHKATDRALAALDRAGSAEGGAK